MPPIGMGRDIFQALLLLLPLLSERRPKKKVVGTEIHTNLKDRK